MRSPCAALFLAVLICTSVKTANADTTAPPNSAFGTPPSGEIPILYDDRTVYAKPDVLRHSRVLAAFLRNHEIYVPLRSMFEQMGATVRASADGNRFVATKPGTTVSVAVGSNEITINGEMRRLDVPPIVYRGVVVVPLRVIAEALGAYVLWVPDKRVVVVRYIAMPSPTPPPPPPLVPPPATPAPTAVPVPVATATPIAAEPEYPAYIQFAASASRNYNEFSDGRYCPDSFVGSAAYIFKDSPVAVTVDYRLDAYVTSDNLTNVLKNHYTHFATVDGGYAYTPVFLARQSNVDERLEFRIAAPRIYVGVGDIQTTNDYGYPHLSAVGFGVEKLPDFRKTINLTGSFFYYPGASGNYTVTDPASPNAGSTYKQQFDILKYDIGASLVIARSPIYINVGFSGDRYIAKQNAPIDQTHSGPYLGLGARL